VIHPARARTPGPPWLDLPSRRLFSARLIQMRLHLQKAHRMIAQASQLAERIAKEDPESASVVGPILLEMKAMAERLCAALQ